MTDVKIAALNGEKETNIIMKTIEIFRIFERKLLEWMCPLYQASPVPVNYWAAQPEVGGDDKQNFICVYKCSPLLTFPLPTAHIPPPHCSHSPSPFMEQLS